MYNRHAMDNKEDHQFVSCWPPPSPEEDSDSENTWNQSHKIKSVHTKRYRTLTGEDTQADSKFSKFDYDKYEAPADVILARWWRTQQKLLSTNSLPEGVSTHTQLTHIAKLPEAKDFMRREIKRLETSLTGRVECATTHTALGTLYERLEECPLAYHHLHTAATKDPSDKETAWLLERVLRQLKTKAAQVTAASRLTNTIPRCLMPTCQVERRSAESLTYEEFLLRYAMARRPVVITGLGDVITATPWTLDHIRAMAGECTVKTRRPVSGSVEWGRLESGPELTVVEIIQRIQDPLAGKSPLYLFDWSLPLFCPKLAERLTIPKYFAGDFLQRTPDGALYQDSWPSLFVAPAGITSELHIDAFGSNFWMALLSGRKRWVFFSPEDTPLLYPSYTHSLDPVFEADLRDPKFDLHPLLTLAQPREVILEEGEVLFVPAGSPHRVENLTNSVAVSANFVDLSNIASVKQELTAQGLVDPRAQELLQALSSPSMDLSVDLKQDHTPYRQFKTQYKGLKQTKEESLLGL